MKAISYLKLIFIIVFPLKVEAQLHKRDSCLIRELSFSAGFLEQQFHWSIAGNYQGQNPNILSELSWKRLRAISFGAGAMGKVYPKMDWMIAFSYHATLSGKVTDPDYKKDNRTD